MRFPVIITRFGVYHWGKFEFEDGTSKDKFFITLNCRSGDREISIVLPTSQVEKWLDGPRPTVDTVIIEDGESEHFSVRTLIDLKNIIVKEKEEIEGAVAVGKVEYVGLLEKPLQERIVRAIKEARTLSKKDIRRLLCE